MHIKDVMEKATPGPWEVVECVSGMAIRPQGTVSMHDRVCDCPHMTKSNAALIAHCVNMFPKLLEALYEVEVCGGEWPDTVAEAIAEAEEVEAL